MTQSFEEPAQQAFADAIAHQLRQARVRQRLTQAQLANRTDGRVSKAALANYETRQRSLRIDVFWVLVRALGEDPGALLAAAERESGYGVAPDATPITIDVKAVEASDDIRLARVKRWFALRIPQVIGSKSPTTVTLDESAVRALAELMGGSVADCRSLLQSISIGHAGGSVHIAEAVG